MKSRKLVTLLVGLLLLAAVGIILGGATLGSKGLLSAKLVDLVGARDEIVGWSAMQQPIAETAEMKRAVGELLNYDDAIFVTYSSAGMRVSIYAAYWSPGKMSHRLIATHTPDVCWVGGGWQRLRQGIEYLDVLDGAKPLRLEYRTYALRGQTEYVVFCHLVGGVPMTYEAGAEPPWYAMFRDLLNMGLRQREEQLFLRISSDRPFEEFKDAPPVQFFMGRLGGELAKMRRASSNPSP